jgi:hypothetical protein
MAGSTFMSDIGKGLKVAGAVTSGQSPSQEEMNKPGMVSEAMKKKEDEMTESSDTGSKSAPSYAEMRGLVNNMRGIK